MLAGTPPPLPIIASKIDTPDAVPLCNDMPDAASTCATRVPWVDEAEFRWSTSVVFCPTRRPDTMLQSPLQYDLSATLPLRNTLFIPVSTTATVTPEPVGTALRGSALTAASSAAVAWVVRRAVSTSGMISCSPSPIRYTSSFSENPGTSATGTDAVTNESDSATSMFRAPISSRILTTDALFSSAVSSGVLPSPSSRLTTTSTS